MFDVHFGSVSEPHRHHMSSCRHVQSLLVCLPQISNKDNVNVCLRNLSDYFLTPAGMSAYQKLALGRPWPYKTVGQPHKSSY